MNSIDFLEHGGGAFHILMDGQPVPLPDPRERHYQWVLMALQLRHVPGTPEGIPEWKRSRVFDHWCAAWDLPNFNDARRLTYLVDHYRAAIANDLAVYTNLDLGDLWRARRWTKLLDIIDRLPAHSSTSSTVSMDEDHAKMMAESIAAQRGAGGEEARPTGPSLTTWTPEVAALTNLLDAVRGVQHAVIAVAAGKKAPEPPKPAPRPVTPLERALKAQEFQRRKASHESLVARLLPHKSRG